MYYILTHQEKDAEIPSACILSYLQTHTYFAHPIDFFVLLYCINCKFIMHAFSLLCDLEQSINKKLLSSI